MSEQTEEGQRVCQQVLKDFASMWQGGPLEYLALYVRDWQDMVVVEIKGFAE